MRRISWDPEKERKNIRKHGIDFKTAATVFDDPFQVNAQDRFENGEYRWQTIGFAAGRHLLLLVAHTMIDEETGDEYIRIISARRASPKDKKRYEMGERGF